MILITTSRRPSRRVRSLCHDLERVIPDVIYINRGKLSFSEVVDRALEFEADRIILIDRWKGGPGRIRFYNITPESVDQSMLLILGGAKTQIDFGSRRNLSRNIALTAAGSSPKKLVNLAFFLSRFLEIPFIRVGLIEEFDAAISVGSTPGREIRIMVTSPPMVREIGPRLIVKKLFGLRRDEEWL